MGKLYPNVVKNHEGDLSVRTNKGLTPLYMCRVGCVVFFRALDSIEIKLNGRAGHIIGFEHNSWDELLFVVQFAKEVDARTIHPINLEVVG